MLLNGDFLCVLNVLMRFLIDNMYSGCMENVVYCDVYVGDIFLCYKISVFSKFVKMELFSIFSLSLVLKFGFNFWKVRLLMKRFMVKLMLYSM